MSDRTSGLSLFGLDGRCCVVTGGAGLLGREFCLGLGMAGATVVVADLDAAGASRTVEALGEQGVHAAVAMEVNLADEGSVTEFVSEVDSRFGTIDVLVNSAAIDAKLDERFDAGLFSRLEQFPLDQWRAVLEVNLTGMFSVTRAVSQVMTRSGRGSIINISSIYGMVGPDQRLYRDEGATENRFFKPAAYSVTKGAVISFSRYLAAYFRETAIRANTLTLGGAFNHQAAAFVSRYSERTLLGRMARPDEYRGPVVFLASDASSYMTGANVVVDGGWTAI